MKWLAFLLLLVPVVAHGQAESEWVIDPDLGGDYATLALWDAAKATDCTAANIILVATCECTGTTAHTSAWTASASWVTDATRYVKVWTDPADVYRHQGTPYQTGNIFRYEMTTTMMTLGTIDFLYIDGLQMKLTSGTTYKYAIHWQTDAASELHLTDCVISGAEQTANSCRGVYMNRFNCEAFISNCIFYDWTYESTAGAFYNDGGDAFISNCTFQNCFNGIYKKDDTNTDVSVYNCIGQDSGNNTIFTNNGTDWEGYDFNITDDGNDKEGGDSIQAEVTFIGEGDTPPDLHLSDSDVSGAIDGGDDLTAGTPAVTDDIDGDARSAPYDMGADELVAAAAAGQIIIVH